jgi:hypothetical protein
MELRHTVADGFRLLMSAMVANALDDILDWKTSARTKDEAMAFLVSPACECLCLTLGVDYKTVREEAAARYRGFLAKAG